MMKGYLIVLILLHLPLTGCKSRTSFELNGSINGKEGEIVILNYSDMSGNLISDTVKIIDGRFKFFGHIDEPTMAYIILSPPIRCNEQSSINVFIEPTHMNIEVLSNDIKNSKLTGSNMQDEYDRIKKSQKEINGELERLRKISYNDGINSTMGKTNAKKANLTEEIDDLEARKNEADILFIKSNPDSYLSAYLLGWLTTSLPLNQLKIYYNSFSDEVRLSSFGKYLNDQITKMERTRPGMTAENFRTIDIENRPFELADFRGKKIVLLDFWASWCISCRVDNAALLDIYRRYNPKGLEIVGIADDDYSTKAWLTAVEHDKIKMWYHILRGLRRIPDESQKILDINEYFGVKTLPIKVLIDREGKIIGKYGSSEVDNNALEIKLKEILK